MLKGNCSKETFKEELMARETSYFVQAFNAGRAGSLKAEHADRLQTAKGALSDGGALVAEQARRYRLLIHRRP